jgi:hypothetical protein
VRVRIISDNDQMATRGSDIERLYAAGVPVRTDKVAAHMHHKFAVSAGWFGEVGLLLMARSGWAHAVLPRSPRRGLLPPALPRNPNVHVHIAHSSHDSQILAQMYAQILEPPHSPPPTPARSWTTVSC